MWPTFGCCCTRWWLAGGCNQRPTPYNTTQHTTISSYTCNCSYAIKQAHSRKTAAVLGENYNNPCRLLGSVYPYLSTEIRHIHVTMYM